MDDPNTHTTDLVKKTSAVAQQILRQPMTRKEFLTYAGGAILALVGVQQLLSVLLGLNRRKTSSNSKSLAYGGGVYGGVEKAGYPTVALPKPK